jgi:hypothetical protein
VPRRFSSFAGASSSFSGACTSSSSSIRNPAPSTSMDAVRELDPFSMWISFLYWCGVLHIVTYLYKMGGIRLMCGDNS